MSFGLHARHHYSVCYALNIVKRLVVVQQDVSLCSEDSSPLSNDFHRPFV